MTAQLGLLDSRIQTPDFYSKLSQLISKEKGEDRKKEKERAREKKERGRKEEKRKEKEKKKIKFRESNEKCLQYFFILNKNNCTSSMENV